MTPLINGTAYAWADIELRLFNVVVAGIRSIKYGDGRKKANNYGQGANPVSRSRGKYEAEEVEIELELAEVVALQSAAPKGRLTDIPPFDIPVSYMPLGGKIVTDKIHNCEFLDNNREAKTEDEKGIVVKLKLICSHVTWAQ